MRCNKALARIASAFACHIVSCAWAQDAVNAHTIELSADHGVTHYRASESLAGKVIAQDRGSLNIQGLVLRFGNAVVTEMAFHRQTGLVPYKGFNQFGFPLLSKTDVDLSSAKIFIDKAFPISNHVPLRLGLGVQQTQWNRVIFNRGSAPSLIENLTATSIQFRVSAKQTSTIFGMASVLESSLNAGHDVRTKLDVASSSGIPDRITLKPGLRPAYELSLSAILFPVPWLGVEYRWIGTKRRFGASPTETGTINGQPFGTVSYPGATQFQNTQVFGLRVRI